MNYTGLVDHGFPVPGVLELHSTAWIRENDIHPQEMFAQVADETNLSAVTQQMYMSQLNEDISNLYWVMYDNRTSGKTFKDKRVVVPDWVVAECMREASDIIYMHTCQMPSTGQILKAVNIKTAHFLLKNANLLYVQKKKEGQGDFTIPAMVRLAQAFTIKALRESIEDYIHIYTGIGDF